MKKAILQGLEGKCMQMYKEALLIASRSSYKLKGIFAFLGSCVSHSWRIRMK